MEVSYYSVYRRPDDRPIYIHGTARECAKAMGIAISTFRSFACRQLQGKKKGGQSKWEIVRDEE